ncbi:hypothetical protein [Ruminococcus albus]|uniref:Uncharacterized protein n=1 Tax=Ruminococcus albus TaxID=1264 RepID=A0A1I1NR15_RUMAL|nr:hypothetical protein [Ruminococcus albus]SFC99885.1 hypothetical protein SAMN02910406_02850 [Ruminococcus albus]
MNIVKRIKAFGVAVLMMTSISTISAMGASSYDKEKTIYKNYGDIDIEKGSYSGGDRIYLHEYFSYSNKTNTVEAYLSGTDLDNYYTFRSAYRINGRTYDSTSGKNKSDEREKSERQEEKWFSYDKKVKGKKMAWVNMRGYTYACKNGGCTNRADLKLTMG